MGKLLRLVPHPDAPPDRVRGVRVRLWQPNEPNRLSIVYRIEGASRLVVPALAPPQRTDRLWESTCFELFARASGAVGYVEFNFSPSSEWAAYAFDSHRSGMREQAVKRAPSVQSGRDEDEFMLRADLAIDALPRRPLRVGINVILEEEWGRRSYWALSHPRGEPDFHHPDCFALELGSEA
ncbi:MAG: hypothetical protein QOE79_964 [Sphingomonadales bacterium]|nr:hypothetical protein [Sphingomonadales bacterium]